MKKRYQIFISSTYLDLKNERQEAMRAVLELNHMPAGMELFPASDVETWKIITDVIDISDYYVLIIGGSYGSWYDEDISFTEKEYDYAVSKKIPIIPFLNSQPVKTEDDFSKKEKLESFREKIKSKHTPQYWQTLHDLKSLVLRSVNSIIQENPRPGWIRLTEISESDTDMTTQKDETKIIDGVLDEESVEILKVIANYSNDDPPEATQIASTRGLNEQKAQYYLDQLLELDYIHAHHNMVYPTRYSLNKNGRKFLVKHGLL